jgi:tetratricopeptide (TPR) repeat protein
MKRWFITVGLAIALGGSAAAQSPAAKTTSAQMSTRAAIASMSGDPQAAIRYADQGIAANPNDPWLYYNKAQALAQLGRTDDAVAAFTQAERRFGPGETWGRSIAVYGRAHALAEAQRCGEARAALDQYVSLVSNDREAVSMAYRAAADCEARARAPELPTETPAPPER